MRTGKTLTPTRLEELRQKREVLRAARAKLLGIGPLPAYKSHPQPEAVPTPEPQPGYVPPPGARIGVHAETGEPVSIVAADLEGGMAIIGRPRKGKTVTMLHMAAHYIAQGMPVIVIDPHEDFVNDLLLRLPTSCIDNIALLDATDREHPFGINPFYCPNPHDDALVATYGDQVHEVLHKVSGDAWGAVLDDIVPNAAYTLLYNPGHSILEFARLLTDSAFRRRLLQNVTNAQVRQAWEDEYDRKSEAAQRTMVQSTVVRIRKFTRNPVLQNILGQSTPTVDFGQLISEHKSILVKLSIRKLGTEHTALLGGLILRQVMAAALEQLTLERSERRQIVLFCDEFQIFATDAFAAIIEQLGKVGLTVVLAHQNFDQISRDVLRAPRNATSHIAFQISNKDAAEKVEEYDAAPPEVERVLHPDPLPYIIRNGHRDPEVVSTLKNLVARVDDELNYILRVTSWATGGYLARLRAQATAVKTASSNYLAAAMGTDDGEAEQRLQEAMWAIGHFFKAPTERELYLGGLLFVGKRLAEPRNHVCSTSSQFDDSLTPGQAKERLRRSLTRLPKLHAYAKLQVNGEAVELPVVIDPPPDIPKTPEVLAKLERVKALAIERGYVRPRAAVEREITRRSAHEQEAAEPVKRRGRRDELP